MILVILIAAMLASALILACQALAKARAKYEAWQKLYSERAAHILEQSQIISMLRGDLNKLTVERDLKNQELFDKSSAFANLKKKVEGIAKDLVSGD